MDDVAQIATAAGPSAAPNVDSSGVPYKRITVRRLCGALGAEVGGVDLAQPLDAEVVAEIRRAFYDNHVICFRGQDLPPASQMAFTRIFGKVEQHPLYRSAQIDGFPEILVLEHKAGEYYNGRNDIWHADVTFAERPPLGSILHCRAIWEGFGDTMFANLCLAYEKLSDGMKRALSGMKAEHSAAILLVRNNRDKYNKPIEDIPPPVLHPVVRTLPETGRKALFVNSAYTTRLADMTVEESKPILDYLYQFGTRPDFIYRHRWRVGDVVMFDNRCLWHYVANDFPPQMHRRMHRTTAEGDAPA
ncbi:MAG: TauD/TfdA family dioxygenase [Alphaproteobacteria bacterium]|nr:TauD/TfdA family dioxygenase [Alphaproteobacteria bacterium]